jgi:hypothetical protein
LSADTQYYYTPIVDGVDWYSAPYPSFKTFPAAGSSAALSFAFGSCTKHSDTIGEDSIFTAIPAEARFFLHLGDTIYADRDPPNATTLADYRTQHRAALAGADVTTQNYKALRARMPVFTTWDDHDLANDFSAGTGSALYAPAKQAFQEYQARANPDSLTSGELYYAFQYGDVGFFVTDGRSFRSADSATDNSSKTLLGATQKAALKNWLLTNKDTLKLKFICSSTPAHGYAANTGGDSWGGVDDGTQAPNGTNGFRTERNEIWDYIDANQIPGVVIISGDQHWAGSFKTAYAGRPRYEFMSTPLNMTNTTSFMLNEVARAADPVNGPVLWKLDKTMNVGVVSVDTTVSPATVSFQLYGTGGSLGASYLTNINADDINANLVPAPAITLSATFPSSPHVGDTVNFDVIATLVGGATGTLTIGVDQLPAGLTLGATSQMDATHYKATVSGTLTTVQDITGTFDATGGSVAATSLTHEFNVQASATGLSVLAVQSFALTTTTLSKPVMFSNVKAGDQIVVIAFGQGSASAPFTVAPIDDQNDTYATTGDFASSGSTDMTSALATVAADAATLTVTVKSAVATYMGGSVYLLRGGTLSIDTADVIKATGVTGTPDRTIGPYSSSGRAFFVALLYGFISGTAHTLATTGATGWTTDSDAMVRSANYQIHTMHTISDAAISSDTFAAHAEVGGSPANCSIAYMLVPFTY